ncbi:hypothetical protein ACFQ1S_08915, partial [Kibdelosporangium lantanae]
PAAVWHTVLSGPGVWIVLAAIALTTVVAWLLPHHRRSSPPTVMTGHTKRPRHRPEMRPRADHPPTF